VSEDGVSAILALVFQLTVPLTLLLVAFFVGSMLERKHLASLLEREQATSPTLTTTLKTPPAGRRYVKGEMVTGSVVISLDYFKRLMAAFRALIGGPVKSFEPLLVRARREAMLRMKEQAIARGYRGVVNVRIETSRLASGRRDGKGTAGIEILAFGTAVTFEDIAP
jgi:uncharacterized protein YbjQ (UPF0145 family)